MGVDFYDGSEDQDEPEEEEDSGIDPFAVLAQMAGKTKKPEALPALDSGVADDAVDPFDFFEAAKRPDPVRLRKAWMEGKKFILGTVENLAAIMDACIASGRYACDLETTGLDNRVKEIGTTGVFTTMDKIAGVGLCPDGIHGYYIPLHHRIASEDGDDVFIDAPYNVPLAIFDREFRRLLEATEKGLTVAIFHNGKFDHEFLQFNETGSPWGEWDRHQTWDDTLILAYLRNTRARRKGLKALSEAPTDAASDSVTGGPGLGMPMIELHELWNHSKVERNFRYDFTTLDLTQEPPLWYAGSDVICTWLLYPVLAPAIEPDTDGRNQLKVYQIEKVCVAATRWMERNLIHIDRDKVVELVTLGQQEWFDSILEVYTDAEKILGRDVMPDLYKEMKRTFVANDPRNLLRFQLDKADLATKNNSSRPPIQKGTETWPAVYDINSQQQIGTMFDELKVPGLKKTEKSGQVKTSKEELDRILEEAGDKFPFMGKVKRFREVSKAMSTYLEPMLLASDPEDDTMRINFSGHKVDTGRFSTPAKESASERGRERMMGWPELNVHSTPSSADPRRPACMNRLRECYSARKTGRFLTLPSGEIIAIPKFMVAIDYAGVELRLATNLSGEAKWLAEFFHCSSCDRTFDRGPRPTGGTSTPLAPPARCPNCGSDKIGDLHTLTALAIYGKESQSLPEWKSLRGHAKCVHPDTMIRTESGYRRMGLLPSVTGAFTPVSTEQVWDGSSWQNLLETYGGGTKPLYHVITRRGVLTCSEEHRMQTLDGTLRTPFELQRGTLMPESVLPQEPLTGQWSQITHKVFNGVPALTIQTTPELAYMAGLILGDGSKNASSCAITHGDLDKSDRMGCAYATWQGILMDACQAAGFDPVSRQASVYLGSRHVIRYLAGLQVYTLPFETSGTRRFRIPDWVWQAGADGLLPFLGGLFDTDGTVSAKDKNLSVTTKDAMFAGHIASALLALGMTVSLDPNWNEKYQRWYFRVKIFREDSLRFIPHMRHPGKLARLRAEGRVAKPQCGRRKPNEVLLVLDAGEHVCQDLHVQSEPHLYWANGFTSHNSTNFALSYGGGGSAVCRSTGVDRNEGNRIKNQFDNTYFGLKNWWSGQHKYARQYGYVRTAFDRKYPVPDIYSTEGMFRSKAERNAVNGPIQGSSADVTKTAMALVYKECKKRGWLKKVMMNITMHDELVFEIDGDVLEEAIPVLVTLMVENPYILAKNWPVPLTTDVEIGYDWTVPWDLNGMRYGEVRFIGNKKYKDKGKLPEGYTWESLPSWPEDLRLWFKEAQGAAPAVPPPPVSLPPTPMATPVEGAQTLMTLDRAQSSFAPTPAPQYENRNGQGTMTATGEYIFRMQSPMLHKTAVQLAGVIQSHMGKGTARLKIHSSQDQLVGGWEALLGVPEIRVNAQEFEAVARYLKL